MSGADAAGVAGTDEMSMVNAELYPGRLSDSLPGVAAVTGVVLMLLAVMVPRLDGLDGVMSVAVGVALRVIGAVLSSAMKRAREELNRLTRCVGAGAGAGVDAMVVGAGVDGRVL